VDLGSQRKGLGDALLLDALRRGLDLALQLGIHAVEVDAIDHNARKFYEKHGFVPLPDNDLHLYLPIATIRDALRPT
jgi:GNAT superfamily N-acetyltransferase